MKINLPPKTEKVTRATHVHLKQRYSEIEKEAEQHAILTGYTASLTTSERLAHNAESVRLRDKAGMIARVVHRMSCNRIKGTLP